MKVIFHTQNVLFNLQMSSSDSVSVNDLKENNELPFEEIANAWTEV